MKKILTAITSFALVIGLMPLYSTVWADPVTEQPPADTRLENLGVPGVDYVEGEVIVCVKGGQAALDAELGILRAPWNNAQEPLMSFMATEPQIEAFTAADAGSAAYFSAQPESSSSSRLLTANAPEEEFELILASTNGEDVPSYIKKLEALDCVSFAEPNYLCQPSSLLDDAQSEPYYPYEWYLDKNSIPVTWDMNAEAAYADPSYSSSDDVVVAVMDSGVDYTHPDLVDVMWSDGLNYPALTALGGGAYGINTSGTGDTSDPMDTAVGHGTHCASTIASTWGNGEGTAGVNTHARIMACCWMQSSGMMSNAIKGYAYVIEAKKQGVPVVAINNSWGSGSSTLLNSPLIVTMINLAGEEGIVSCFAAGNSSLNHDKFTNLAYSSPYVITIGAMNSLGENAWFSDFGKTCVDVFAPGTQILAATTLYDDAVLMSPMYLPWIDEDKSLQGTFVFEDFEDDTDTVQITDLEGNGPLTVMGGYASEKARGLEYSGLSEGAEVGFQVKIPLKSDENPNGAVIPEADTYYLAFEADVAGFNFIENESSTSPIMLMQYLDASGKWVDPSEELRWLEIDGNWSLCQGAVVNLEEMADAAIARGDNCITIRFKGIANSVWDTPYFYIDSVGLGTKTSKYYYSDGTSMATPCATGVVSLVAGSRGGIPTDGAAALDVIARVKGSVARTGLLDDVCITQGCVQATAMLASDADMNPVPDAVAINGDGTATIAGYFFGESGTVSINGVAAEVSSWSDRSIIVKVPTGTPYGLIEYCITRSDGMDGRNFGIFTNEHDYQSLPLPTSTYQNANGQEISAADLVPVRITATDDGIFAALSDTDSSIAALQFFSFDTQEWVDVPYPEGFNALASPVSCLTALAGGKNEIYLITNQIFNAGKSDAQAATHLLTFDTSTLTWVYNVKLPSSYSGSEILALDKEGRLLAALGSSSTNSGVCQLFPDTGLCSLPITTMPKDSIGGSGGALLISGDTQIATGINGGIIAIVLESITHLIGAPCDEPLVFDGAGEWTSSKTSFFNNKGNSFTDPSKSEVGLDADQSLLAAYGALDGGFIMAGPARGITTPDMVDTWVYDAASDSYTALDARVDAARLQTQAGTTHDNTFYVMGFSASEGKLVFRSLDLKSRNLSCTDATANAQRSTESPLSIKTAIGSTWLDSENGGYYLVNADGELTHEGASENNYQVAFDEDSNKVTLNNLTFKGVQESRSALKRGAIFSSDNLTIELHGVNEISGLEGKKGLSNLPRESIGIYSMKSVTFTGDGDLLVKSGTDALEGTGVAAEQDIVFAGTGTIECTGRPTVESTLNMLGGLPIAMCGVAAEGTVDVQSGTVVARTEDLTPTFLPSAAPSDLSGTGIRANNLLTSGNANLTASAGDIATLRGGTSIGIQTENAPVYGPGTVVSTHGAVTKAKKSGGTEPGDLSDDQAAEFLGALLLNGSLNQEERTTLFAGNIDELNKLLAQDAADEPVMTALAYTTAPTVAASADATAWYGANESEALAAGEKTLGELASNLAEAYTKVAGADHAAEPVAGQPATCENDGWKDCWRCTTCGAYFEDEACTKLIGNYETWKTDAGRIDATGHEWGPWQPYDETQHVRVCANDPSHAEYANHEFGDDGTCAACGFFKPAPEPSYQIIAGQDSTWTKGASVGASFASSAPFAKFNGVLVDGSVVLSADYEAWEGSTWIRLRPIFLEGLSTGKHELTIVSIDGSASCKFTVKASASPTPSPNPSPIVTPTSSKTSSASTAKTAPGTGDSLPLTPLAITAVTAAALTGIALRATRCKQNNR